MSELDQHLLEISDLNVSFDSRPSLAPAVNGVSFFVDKGETVGIVGESGSGKSVTALSILKLHAQSVSQSISGSIRFNGEELLTKSEKDMSMLRGNHVAMIFQEPMSSLNPAMTIGSQLMEVIKLHQKVSKKEAKAKAVESLTLVGIPAAQSRLSSYPFQLSGGQRQRVMIAMALLCEPQLLIADEPTTALDVTIQAQILDVLKDLKDRIHASILMITHDFGVVADIADRVVVMYAGKVVEEGKVRDVLKNPLHPYTQGLLSSIPQIGPFKERLHMIRGSIPKPDECLTGCRFCPRCDSKREICEQQEPAYRLFEGQRGTRCWIGTDEYDTSTKGRLP
ncbi:ABC transporter ATP-binding protein [Cohnella abietis]|uniref:Peptide ABC transporter ATP-binding protein n=1 Tax=Cohnella abietis TaxID=2507935 RepID=A0A3T1DCU0_9BACL|nr:ABC transporter ATP-binding protein [Cohnella abietis]BBI35909.1 peptide ABC transporter ATP-binding protein [Cohnella abietis]